MYNTVYMSKRFLIFILSTSILLFGCQLVNRILQKGGRDLSTYGVARNDAIVLTGGQPRTLDPALTLGGPSGALGHIFSGLVSLDAQLQVQPELAAGWTVSEDGLVYTFFLRKNGVFHNGRFVTAQDVIFSWNRATDPELGSDTAQTYLGDIAGVEDRLNGRSTTISGLRAIDDYTLEVRLQAPVVYFLAKLAYPATYIVDPENVSQSNWEHKPNGSGPFRLQAWEDDDIIVLERNDRYYLEPAYVKHLVYDLGAGLPLSMYETGEIDLVGIGGGSLERVQDPNDPLNPDLRLGVSMCTSVIGLNTQVAPFDDVRVRQAFNYALDKQRLIDTFSNGQALIANGSLPPGMPGFGGLIEPTYPFDPAKARELLAEAGYADPTDLPTLTYTTSGYGDAGGYVTAVITLWQETLGVTIKPVVLDPFIFYDELYAGSAGNFYGSGWCADYPDPQNFLDILYHSDSLQNIGGFANAEIDFLLEQARIETDTPQRIQMYQEAERQLVNQAPTVFVSHGVTAVLVNPALDGYTLAPIGVRQWHRVSVTR